MERAAVRSSSRSAPIPWLAVVGRANSPTDAGHVRDLGVLRRPRGPSALVHEWTGYVGIGDPYSLSSIAAVVLGGISILGEQATYFRTIAGAVLLVTMTALIPVVNASEGWRSVILGCLILLCCHLSGRDQSR